MTPQGVRVAVFSRRAILVLGMIIFGLGAVVEFQRADYHLMPLLFKW